MAINELALVAEIQHQLNGDLLSYGWLRQIVRDLEPTIDRKMIAKLVYDAVVRLYDSGYAIVGTAKEIDGKVLVVPWDGTRHEVLSRLDRFMTTAGDSPVQDDLNVFWLERTSLL